MTKTQEAEIGLPETHIEAGQSHRCFQGHVKTIALQKAGGLELRLFPPINDNLKRQLSVYHITMPAGYRHESLCHVQTHEWFYILEGSTTITVDQKARHLVPGSFLYIAPRVYHQVRAEGKDVKVMVFFSPPMSATKPDILFEGQKQT